MIDDLAHNTPKIAAPANSECNHLSTRNISVLLDVLSVVMDMRACAHVSSPVGIPISVKHVYWRDRTRSGPYRCGGLDGVR